jgi:uncharacterized protein (DUF169 family)
MPNDWNVLAGRLQRGLGLAAPPIAITFTASLPTTVPAFDEPMPGPAGCVFWMKSTDRTFTTVAEDHANCSVGAVTHGFKTLADVGANEDVAALLESGWVNEAAIPTIPVVSERPAAVVYGPLANTPVEPDVALVRITGRQLMVLHDAFPDLRIEGKPQCHIVALAKEQGVMAASVGCQLSRVRTGMSNAEMTCAIPAAMVPDVIARIEQTAVADNAVARYASEDMKRFA